MANQVENKLAQTMLDLHCFDSQFLTDFLSKIGKCIYNYVIFLKKKKEKEILNYNLLNTNAIFFSFFYQLVLFSIMIKILDIFEF